MSGCGGGTAVPVNVIETLDHADLLLKKVCCEKSSKTSNLEEEID